MSGPLDLSRAAAIEINRDLYTEAESRTSRCLNFSNVTNLTRARPAHRLMLSNGSFSLPEFA